MVTKRSVLPLVPGVAMALVATAASMVASSLLARWWGVALSPLVLSLVLGAVLGSARLAPGHAASGLAWTSKRVLRAGVVLLGLQLSLSQVADLGWRGVAVILVTVACTFAGTLAVGQRLGVPPLTRLYVATGFSICGAAAIAAMQGTIQQTARSGRGDDPPEEADALGISLALVTLYGSLAIVVLPWLVTLLGLSDADAGLWIGASVQEVAQVVAAAGVVSGPALAAATVAKLARVVLLAPLTAGLAVTRRSGAGARRDGPRVAVVPLFVLGFLAAVLVRSTGLVPDGLLDVAENLSKILLAAAMFALGTGVNIPRLVTTGARPLALGAVGTLIAGGVSLGGILLLA